MWWGIKFVLKIQYECISLSSIVQDFRPVRYYRYRSTGMLCKEIGYEIQPVKCNVMHLTRKRLKLIHASYTLEGTVLENIKRIKYLGVTITNDLRWNTHFSNTGICSKANRIIGFLKRTLYTCPQEINLAAHKGLVRPLLACSGYVWDPSDAGFQDELRKHEPTTMKLGV